MRFAVLSSGSSGNATLVATSSRAVLIDCGTSIKRLAKAASDIDFDLSTLAAIIVTHEHDDHASGVGPLARRYGIPVYGTPGTLHAVADCIDGDIEVKEFSPHAPYEIGDITVHPTPVPHDAREPCQLVFSRGSRRFGMLTDVGTITPHLRTHFSGCTALLLEFNHDPAMLRDCEYPQSLKRRIGGRLGHLSNFQAADFLRGVTGPHLRNVVAAHVSERSNSNDKVCAALVGVLHGTEVAWAVAEQHAVLPWRDVPESH